MASIPEIRETRINKIKALKDQGIEAYPASSQYDVTLKEAAVQFEALEKKSSVTLVGRVMSLRPQGALAFLNFNDGTGMFQALLKNGDIDEAAFNLFIDTVDVGDYIQVSGTLFLTKTEQKTILIKDWKMLAKSLRPLPEKWHGLQDVEERFRRRYLDALMSEDVRTRFITRSRVITHIRKVLDTAGFLEVETPSLQPLYGGASAEPFVTHHNALDIDLYLRISNELYLKRMLVAGFPKVYEFARDFRNEGIDATHNPEFTMVEWYEAFSDYKKQMAFVESMIKGLVQELYGAQVFEAYEYTIDTAPAFSVMPYFDIIKTYAGIENPGALSVEALGTIAKTKGVEVTKADSKAKILDNIYKKLARPSLIQPTFIVDYPAEYLPLAKRKTDNPEFVEAFQLVIAGVELVKAFSELNDPIDQRERFEEQERNKQGGETDAQSMDTDFLEAMEHGMPPAGGVGIGIDRLTMVLTNTKNIKEVIFFPTMKPRE